MGLDQKFTWKETIWSILTKIKTQLPSKLIQCPWSYFSCTKLKYNRMLTWMSIFEIFLWKIYSLTDLLTLKCTDLNSCRWITRGLCCSFWLKITCHSSPHTRYTGNFNRFILPQACDSAVCGQWSTSIQYHWRCWDLNRFCEFCVVVIIKLVHFMLQHFHFYSCAYFKSLTVLFVVSLKLSKAE